MGQPPQPGMIHEITYKVPMRNLSSTTNKKHVDYTSPTYYLQIR